MCHKRHHRSSRSTLAAILTIVLLLTSVPQALSQEDRDAAWQQMLEGITVLANLALIRDAVIVLNEGGPDAETLREDPGEFLRRGGLKLVEDALVFLLRMENNPALTPPREQAGDPQEGFALTQVAIAFSGPQSGVLVRRKIANETAARQSFEGSAIDLTLWMEQSLGYIARVIHRLNQEEDTERMDFFLAAPAEFFVEEAVLDKQLGTGITFSFLEQAALVAYDLARAGDAEVTQFFPEDQHSEEGVVTISIGYVSEDWAFFVELARISQFDGP